MKPKRSLPVLLVSACDRTTAEEFISELIDNEVTETDGEVEQGGGGAERAGRVWRLVNKYYSADVMVRARADADPPHPARVEAHVAYFTPEECEAAPETVVACAERRVGAAVAAVRVAALRAAGAGALAAWAARARVEPVPLRDPAEGLPRVRDALHAHPWPGLRRLDRAAPDLSFRDSDESSSCGEEGKEGEEGEDEEAEVERAEQFALALGSLAELGGGARRLADGERRLRAELLLEAFCRALGQPLD